MQDRPILKLKSFAANNSQELGNSRPKLTLKLNDSYQLKSVTDKPLSIIVAKDKSNKLKQNLDQATISEQETLVNKDNSTKANKQKKKPKYYLQPDIYKEMLGFFTNNLPSMFY